MRLKPYITRLLSILDNTPYCESRQISFDERPPDSAVTKLTVTFIDGSCLYLKEFVIFQKSRDQILKYGYQYLAADGTLIFRYDNALDPAARFLSTWPSHKHTTTGIVSANCVSHKELFDEIAEIIAQSEESALF